MVAKSALGGGFVSIKIKLNAVVFPEDHKIFKFFPGRGYKFHDYMEKSELVFMDIRNLNDLGEDPARWNQDRVLDHIAADRVEQAVEDGEERPTRIIRTQGDKAAQTFLNGLLFSARKGDVLLMPNRGYTTDVMIGQFADDAGSFVKVEIKTRSGQVAYFARRVRWVRGVEKRRFSDAVQALLQTQPAFFDIGRSHYENVYRLAFDDFVYDQQFFATFRTGKKIFTPKDSFLTSVWLELLEVLEEAREGGVELPAGSIYELVIASDIDEQARDDLSISVQSPGWFRIRSTAAAPLASLALFAMAAEGVPFEEAKAAEVSATVVRQDAANCVGAVDASVRDYINLLGKQRWEQACKLATQADAEAKLKAGARVTRGPKEKGGSKR